ncbi:MAG: Hsp20/alpha crystallin family protein [Nanobdellota archaeon]
MFGRDPIFKELARMQKEMDSMFDNFFGRTSSSPMLGRSASEQVPALADYTEPVADMFETDNEIVSTIEMPGIDKKDIQVNATDDGIEVKVEKKDEKKDEDKKRGYYSLERKQTGYYRYFPLPAYAEKDKIDATYKNGVLEVRIPKSQEQKEKKKQIEVQ